MKEALRCLTKNYGNFEGRATRKEYFFFYLIAFSFLILFGVITELVHVKENVRNAILALALLYVVIPSLSLTVRRFHDFGRSGWWILLDGIPLIGLIVECFLLFKKGDEGANRFGENLIPLKEELA